MPDKPRPRLTVVEDRPRRKPPKRVLTAKQERFVAEVVKGSTASDAYRAAYNADGMKASAVWVESSRLMGNPIVALRLQANRDSIERSAVSSALSRRRWIIERLELEAVSSSDATRVRALELLGKTTEVRLFTDIVETTNTASPDEVRRELEARLTALLAGTG